MLCSSTVGVVCAGRSALSTSSLWCFSIPTLLLACGKSERIEHCIEVGTLKLNIFDYKLVDKKCLITENVLST